MDRFLSTDLFKKSSCQSSNGGQVQSSTRLLQLENGGSVAQKSVFALRTLHSSKVQPPPGAPPPLFNTHPLPYTRSAGLLSINSKRWWRNKPPSSPPCLGVPEKERMLKNRSSGRLGRAGLLPNRTPDPEGSLALKKSPRIKGG